MNFTSDVKREIIARGISGGAATKAALSAFVRTSGQLSDEQGAPTFSIVTETENVAEFFTDLFEETFETELSVARASMDRMSRRDKLVLECPRGNSSEILRKLGILKKDGTFSRGISKRLVSGQESAVAYIKGAFLGGGSCILPGKDGGKTGYHLEFVFAERKTAEDFRLLLDGVDLLAKVVGRAGAAVVYIKSKEAISDFLSVAGAENALKKFSELVERRDEANNFNRAANCFSGNADKAATAAVKQVMAIEKLTKSELWNSLSGELKTVAEARLNNPALSLRELADLLGIGKSCLSHRMRRLMESAEKSDEKNNSEKTEKIR